MSGAVNGKSLEEISRSASKGKVRDSLHGLFQQFGHAHAGHALRIAKARGDIKYDPATPVRVIAVLFFQKPLRLKEELPKRDGSTIRCFAVWPQRH
jgi:hypothetical protein